MRLEDLQAAARQLPQHQPDEAKKAALRASLVETARTERPAAPRRAVPALIAACAVAAAAILWWVSARSQGEVAAVRPAAAMDARRATIQSSSGANFEHTRVPGTAASDPIDEVVRLRQGRVAVAVEHLSRGERFRVVTGDAEVEVRGTSFDVVVVDDRLAEVTVHTGVVDVRPEGREAIALHPGESWRVADHPVRTAAIEPAGEEPPVSAPIAAVTPPADEGPPPAIPSSSGGTTSKAPPGVEHRGGLVHRSSPDRVAVPDEQPVPDEPPRASDAPATQEELTPAGQKAAPTASEMAFGRGFRALRRGNYGEASEQFELAITSGPGSRLVDDARYWRAVALARSGQSAAAREALDEFLRLHARSPRAGEASVMLGWMLVESGDRTGAFRRFKAAAGDRDPAVRASAAKGLARIKDTR